MSVSMLLGRLVLPALGLALAAALAWNLVQTGQLELPAEFTRLGARAGIPAPAAAPPAPADAGAPRIVAEGRVVAYPGAQVVVGAEVTGTITRVLVQEKAAVKKGELLVEFRADELRAQLAEANARLAEVEADYARIAVELERLAVLVTKSASSRQEYDRTKFDVMGLKCRRDAMAAARDRLAAQLERYRVTAPIDGVVTARLAQPGETVGAAAPLATIVDLKRLRIEAEIDEYDIAYCRPGSAAMITAESYPGRSWRGEVEEVADALVGRKLRPEDPGRPTDTRVLPVRIALREPTPLRLGQRVEVAIERLR